MVGEKKKGTSVPPGGWIWIGTLDYQNPVFTELRAYQHFLNYEVFSPRTYLFFLF